MCNQSVWYYTGTKEISTDGYYSLAIFSLLVNAQGLRFPNVSNNQPTPEQRIAQRLRPFLELTEGEVERIRADRNISEQARLAEQLAAEQARSKRLEREVERIRADHNISERARLAKQLAAEQARSKRLERELEHSFSLLVEKSSQEQIPVADGADGEDRNCCVCLESEKTHAIMPCGHMCVCSACADVIMGGSHKCPLCNRGVTSMVRIFR